MISSLDGLPVANYEFRDSSGEVQKGAIRRSLHQMGLPVDVRKNTDQLEFDPSITEVEIIHTWGGIETRYKLLPFLTKIRVDIPEPSDRPDIGILIRLKTRDGCQLKITGLKKS